MSSNLAHEKKLECRAPAMDHLVTQYVTRIKIYEP
jgi:hypothetical protein